MTEENERPGGGPGVSAAGAPGERSVPVAPAVPAPPAFEPTAVPPKPSTPPTSATPVVPLAAPPAAQPARPSVPPVSRPDAGQPGPRQRRGDRDARGAQGARSARSARSAQGAMGSAGAALAGAGSAASEKASQLAGLVRRQSPARIGGALAAVVVMGLLIWWLTSLGVGGSKQPDAGVSPAAATTSSAPASRGPLPLEGVGPLDFQLGDCFKDFDPEAPQSTIVDCTAGHSAQLIAIEHYAVADSYPGRDPLKQKALDICKAAPMTDKQSAYALNYKLAYPSSSSWDNGDRRVDCYVTADNGNVIMESLIP